MKTCIVHGIVELSLCSCIQVRCEPPLFQWKLCSFSYGQAEISLASMKACIVDMSARAMESCHYFLAVLISQIWDLNLDHCFPKLCLQCKF